FREGRAAAAAVLRAHRDFRRQKTAIRTFRTLTPNPGIFTPHTTMNRYLLYEYYIRKRKTFTELRWR
ncbi:MAG: hypothetical protein WAZ35_03585, partial [Bacteroidales bacterium]